MAEKSFNIKKLTNRAHKVLEIALWRALASDRTSISSEHLLAGLLEEGAGIAMHILGSLGVDVTNLKSDLGEFVASAEPDHLTPHKLPLASDLETVLRLSA